jgi:hypothetical protein
MADKPIRPVDIYEPPTSPRAASMLEKFVHYAHNDANGFARPEHFSILFTFAPNTSDNVDTETISLSCHSVNIPGFSILSTPYHIYGIPVEMPYEVSFLPVTASFYIDGSHKLIKYLHAIKDRMFDTKTFSPYYRDEYAIPKVTILVSRKDDVPVQEYHLHNVIVKSVDSLPMTWASTNSLLDASVSLGYEYITVESPNSSSPPKPASTQSSSVPIVDSSTMNTDDTSMNDVVDSSGNLALRTSNTNTPPVQFPSSMSNPTNNVTI